VRYLQIYFTGPRITQRWRTALGAAGGVAGSRALGLWGEGEGPRGQNRAPRRSHSTQQNSPASSPGPASDISADTALPPKGCGRGYRPLQPDGIRTASLQL